MKRAVLLCGFLGSGKTTLLKNILSKNTHVTVIETEFAINFSLEEDLADSSSSAVRVYEFGSNACVCCSSSGEFKAAVASFVKDDSSSLLVVELTGTARVEFVSRSLLLSGLVVLVVCVLDTLFFESQPEELVRSCLVAADVVVLSKTDESTPQRVNEARQLALRLSPAAMVISSSLKEPADIDFGFCRKKSDDSSSDLVAAHTTSLSWSCASRDGPVDPQLFGLLLEGFLKDHKEVMRCKGVLFPESARPVCLLQGVFDRVQVSTASRMSREGNDSSRVSLVCDANHAEKLVVDVQRLLEAAAVIQHSPDVVVRIIDDQLIESVIECEQQAFARERICLSHPEDLRRGMMYWLAEWSRVLVHTRTSFCAVHSDGTVLSVCLCELFPPLVPFVLPGVDPRATAPIEEILGVLEAELIGLTTGKLPLLDPRYHERHVVPALAERMFRATKGGRKQVLHVCQIGCLSDPRSSGLVRVSLLAALRSARLRGVLFAFAETSGPQSTALCRGMGAQIVLTSYMNLFSSFDFVRSIPECEDRNPDVVNKFAPRQVPPVIRLVVWDLETLFPSLS